MFSEIVKSVLDVFLPDLCRSCGEPVEREGGESGICGQCYAQVTYIDRGQWCRCGRTRFTVGSCRTDNCGKCVKRPAFYDRLVSLCEYEGPVCTLLHRLKYQGDTSVLPALMSIGQRVPDSFDIDCDLILPVPLHRMRLQSRGLNQSLCLAKSCLREKSDKISPFILYRHMSTPPQTGLSLNERRRNLKNVFSLRRVEQIRGKKICLVDDVFTSGSTIQECSKVLKKGGASEVTAVTFAMAIRNDQRLV